MPTSLASKLQLKAGQTLTVLNAPAGAIERLAAELSGLTVVAGAGGPPEAVLLFVNNLAEAGSLTPGAMRAVQPGGPLWIAYPKQASKVETDVNRDRLWEALQPTGWRPIRQIALDEVWSAMRFRLAEEVGR